MNIVFLKSMALWKADLESMIFRNYTKVSFLSFIEKCKLKNITCIQFYCS